MKKIFLLIAIATMFTSVTMASSSYKINDAAIDVLFDQSIEVNYEFNASAGVLQSQSVGGFLLRSFFCGFIGLHRSYMGTGGETMWWKYFCIPVVGGVVNCVDFWYVVFKGSDALGKYKDNGKYIVWAN
ncbi:MAG: hypothetical protein M3Q58_08710 [Bacteroidota bacterium]|nr:hypothetical protein [Bacteroidota bacterium]